MSYSYDRRTARSRIDKTLERDLERSASRLWDVYLDDSAMPELVGNYKNPNQDSEAAMTVTFPWVDDVLLDGDRGEARIWFSSGADYEGNYGVQEVNKPFSNLRDIKAIFKEAERLWKRWAK